MHVVATLLVRDEEEIVKECIEHHLRRGVDAFIVTDNGSTDATRKIVAACPGVVEIIDEPTHNHHQSRWVSRMAKRAHELGAHWVVHIDADEFWYGLEALHEPARFKNAGVVTVMSEWLHVPVPGLVFGEFTRAQMPYCREVSKPMPKVIHRGCENPVVAHGNHSVGGVPGKNIQATGISIHHFPVRSYAQFESKTVKGGTALQQYPGPSAHGKQWRDWYKNYRHGKLNVLYSEKLYTPSKIEADLRTGNLHRHTDEVEVKTNDCHNTQGAGIM